jgi:hypothetical protein
VPCEHVTLLHPVSRRRGASVGHKRAWSATTMGVGGECPLLTPGRFRPEVSTRLQSDITQTWRKKFNYAGAGLSDSARSHRTGDVQRFLATPPRPVTITQRVTRQYDREILAPNGPYQWACGERLHCTGVHASVAGDLPSACRHHNHSNLASSKESLAVFPTWRSSLRRTFTQVVAL